MKYVLDSSVALKWVLPEPDSANAIRLRAASQNGVHELLAPSILHVEVAHALTRVERQRRIAVSAGWPLWRTIMVDCPALTDSYPLMRRAFELSSQARIGVYDCLYVALAEAEQCSVATADERLLKTFPARTISLASLP
ncbi:MAG TPA: type II toxin-antitoxin system VapC family toxin [Pirellulales bacterium]